jgi:oligoribonuclease
LIDKKNDNLVWIDLEMSGLSPDIDVILEIATIVTDNELSVLEKGPSIVIHHEKSALLKMSDWSRKQHHKSGLLDLVESSSCTIADAEKETLSFLKRYCIPQTALLCGNSVWQDRAFLRKYMPNIIDFLHYRIVDVTSFKEVIARWYADSGYKEFVKKDTHRAFDDILESIEELRYYRKYFFISQQS